MRIERVLLPLALALLGSAGLPRVSAAETSCRSPLLIDRLGVEDGLSHNAVFAITQDRHGFLWFGTQGGLDRWDGARFVSYRPDDVSGDSLGSHFVSTLLEDRRGRLWVGTADGLFRLGAERRRFERVELPIASDRIVDLVADASGDVWAATARALVRIGPDESAKLVADEPGRPETFVDLVRDREGRIWVVRTHPPPTTLELVDGDGRGREILLSRSRIAATPARAGGLWIDPGAPPVRGDEARLELVDFIHLGPSALHEDSAGRLWVGSFRGLFVREPGGSICRAGSDSSDPHRLYDEINAFFEDRDGTVWVGTYGGLLRYDPHRKPFHHLPATEPSPSVGAPLGAEARGDPVSSVAVDQRGAVWVGTYGSGIHRLDPGSGFRVETIAGDRNACADYVWDLELGTHGELWVATTEGLCVLEAGSDHLRLRSKLGRTEVADIERDALGRYWLGTAFGLARFDPATGVTQRVQAPGPGGGPVDTVLVDADGTVWGAAGFGGRGLLVRWRNDRLEHFPSLVPEGIWDLLRARDGRLWLATGAGLRWLEDTGDGFEVHAPPGVPISVVYSLREDSEGRLWAGTSRGLLRYDPSGRSPARLFDLGDGSGSLEFNRHAATTDGDTLYFAGMRGVTRFRPEEIQEIDTVPPVVVTDIRVLGETGERHPNPFTVDTVTLEPSDTTLEVEFVALAFTQPKKNRYRYRLEGFDDAWVDAEERGFARYTGLDPGHYVFHASGSNADGVWNESGTTLGIVVRPAIWETLWFRALAVLSLVAALFAWHRRRIGRLLEMERLRVRIASDLHDDLSSDLSGVALAAESMARRAELSDEDRTRLAQVRDTARHLVDGVRDIVWAINPEHDTMEATVRKMRQVARDLLVECDWSFEASPAARSGGIDMTHRRDLLLIFKESLHNVVRHARAERVDVDLEMEGSSLLLRVADDGVGFDPATVEAGNGLASIRRRAAVMGAELDLRSHPGRGTRLLVRIPRTRDGGARAPVVRSAHS